MVDAGVVNENAYYESRLEGRVRVTQTRLHAKVMTPRVALHAIGTNACEGVERPGADMVHERSLNPRMRLHVTARHRKRLKNIACRKPWLGCDSLGNRQTSLAARWWRAGRGLERRQEARRYGSLMVRREARSHAGNLELSPEEREPRI
ncbi:hypothetical protein BDW22DRAFT_1348925 [Trametopsis cervina]|nr:hypothetical protein BDW22DRAFT_1348925 [Trametopsis cervina]